jgi:hypothetical protein
MANDNELLREEETYKTGRASLYTASTILTMLHTRCDRTSRSSSRRKTRIFLAAQPEPSSRPAQSRTFVATQPEPSSLRNPNLPRAPQNPEPSLLRNPNLPCDPESFLALVVP